MEPTSTTTSDAEPTPDASADAPRPRRKRSLKRRVKKALRRFFVGIMLAVIPRLYLYYMRFVYWTSKVEVLGPNPDWLRARHGKGVYAVWHDEVVFVAYAFGKHRPHTLASQSDVGELITRMLVLCGFQVFRGGSSTSRKRRKTQILDDMVECIKTEEGVIFGITTDGSNGPIYRMKWGAVKLAQQTGAPVGAQKTWCKRYFRLKTWDRTIVPLPFNHIVSVFQGPFHPPEPTGNAREDTQRLRAFGRLVERAQCRVAGVARRRAEGRVPEAWVAQFPEDFQDDVRDPTEPVYFLETPDQHRDSAAVDDALSAVVRSHAVAPSSPTRS